MKRIRVIQFVVKPVLVTDDGERLEPLDVAPVTVPAHEMESFMERWPRLVVDTEAQINAEEIDVELDAIGPSLEV